MKQIGDAVTVPKKVSLVGSKSCGHGTFYKKSLEMDSNFTVIDFETTGFSNVRDKVIQVSAIKYRGFEIVDQYNTLVNPKRVISEEVQELTGISMEDVEDKPTEDKIVKGLLNFIGRDRLVAHNAPFDMGFLTKMVERNKKEVGIETTEMYETVDTLTIAREILNYPSYKLEDIKHNLGIEAKSHNALEDCRVTGELYKVLYLELYLKEMSV